MNFFERRTYQKRRTKMFERLKNDELIFHKAGLVIGAIVGVVVGFIVSDQADNYVEFIEEEIPADGSEKD
jgi:hypothetical protein